MMPSGKHQEGSDQLQIGQQTKIFTEEIASNSETPTIFLRCGGLPQWLKGASPEALKTTVTSGETMKRGYHLTVYQLYCSPGGLGVYILQHAWHTAGVQHVFEEGGQARQYRGGRILQLGQPRKYNILPRRSGVFSI